MTGTQLRACALSETAWQLLARHPAGTVHSVYKNTVNLNCGGELLVSITSKNCGVHPFSICMDTDALEPPPEGSVYTAKDGVISIGSLRFSYEGARRVNLQMHGRLPGPQLEEMAPLLDAVLSEAAVSRSPLGFLLVPTQTSPLEHWREDFIALADGIISGNPDKSAAYGQKLLGMGWGLTPSADDYCVGLLAVKQFVHGPFPAAGCGAFSRLAGAAYTRTNKISFNFLYHACRGCFSQVLQAWLKALAKGELLTAAALTERLAEYGHSSGTDTMVGAALGLKQIVGCIDNGGNVY